MPSAWPSGTCEEAGSFRVSPTESEQSGTARSAMGICLSLCNVYGRLGKWMHHVSRGIFRRSKYLSHTPSVS